MAVKGPSFGTDTAGTSSADRKRPGKRTGAAAAAFVRDMPAYTVAVAAEVGKVVVAGSAALTDHHCTVVEEADKLARLGTVAPSGYQVDNNHKVVAVAAWDAGCKVVVAVEVDQRCWHQKQAAEVEQLRAEMGLSS